MAPQVPAGCREIPPIDRPAWDRFWDFDGCLHADFPWHIVLAFGVVLLRMRRMRIVFPYSLLAACPFLHCATVVQPPLNPPSTSLFVFFRLWSTAIYEVREKENMHMQSVLCLTTIPCRLDLGGRKACPTRHRRRTKCLANQPCMDRYVIESPQCRQA